MNRTSTIIGLFALVLGIIGFFPMFDWLIWLVLFLTFFGMIFGLSEKGKTGGITINFLVMLFAILRLYVGGGII